MNTPSLPDPPPFCTVASLRSYHVYTTAVPTDAEPASAASAPVDGSQWFQSLTGIAAPASAAPAAVAPASAAPAAVAPAAVAPASDVPPDGPLQLDTNPDLPPAAGGA